MIFASNGVGPGVTPRPLRVICEVMKTMSSLHITPARSRTRSSPANGPRRQNVRAHIFDERKWAHPGFDGAAIVHYRLLSV